MQLDLRHRLALAVALPAFALAVTVLIDGALHTGGRSLAAGGATFGSVVLLAPWIMQLLHLGWLGYRVREQVPDRNADAMWLSVAALSGVIASGARQVESASGSWAESLLAAPVSPVMSAAALVALTLAVIVIRPAPGSRLAR